MWKLSNTKPVQSLYPMNTFGYNLWKYKKLLSQTKINFYFNSFAFNILRGFTIFRDGEIKKTYRKLLQIPILNLSSLGNLYLASFERLTIFSSEFNS